MFILGSFDDKRVDDPKRAVLISEHDQDERRRGPEGEDSGLLRPDRKPSCSSSSSSSSLTKERLTLSPLSLPLDLLHPIAKIPSGGGQNFSPLTAVTTEDAASESSSFVSGTRTTASRKYSYSTFESSHGPADPAEAPNSELSHPRHELNTNNRAPRKDGRDCFTGGSTVSASTTRTTAMPETCSVMERIRSSRCINSSGSKDSRSNRDELSCLWLEPPSKPTSRRRRSVLVGTIFVAVAAITATAAWILNGMVSPRSDDGLRYGSPHERGSELVWRWDHNLYHPANERQQQELPPTRSAHSESLGRGREQSGMHNEAAYHPMQRRNLLVVQMGTAQVTESSSIGDNREPSWSSTRSSYLSVPWLEISSRPNRAYAKQWGMDYVTIETPPPAIESKGRQGLWPWNRATFGFPWGGDERTTWPIRLSERRNQFGLDAITVLRSLLDRQEVVYQAKTSYEGSQDDAQVEPTAESAVTYDAIVLIPSNAVIIDFDYDLLRLIPEDSLVALSRRSQRDADGYGDSDSADESHRGTFLEETLLVFNLQHPYARMVVEEWSDLSLGMLRYDDAREQGSASREGSPDASEREGCGQAGDDCLLLQAIDRVELERKDKPSPLVLHLTQSSDGFVGRDDDNPHVIKTIALNPTLSDSSTPRSNTTDVSMSGMPAPAIVNAVFALQTAADSVCYRYYPKCDVL